MGAVAADLVDFAVLTSEDPRFEDPERIIDDIARAIRARGRVEGRDFIRVPDRRAAIRAAFARARPGDLVVLAGKGHERSIIVGRERVPWDEQRVAEEELAGLGWMSAEC
jgi:UDP-N-acetylmuramoyl-L-alanyl-D-glutamate--2,6-diaminopimelate ligase